jgi:hypothetical protein
MAQRQIGGAVPDSSGFAVLPEALIQHANSVIAAADALDQAADAGLSTMLSPLAYGLMCQMLPMVLNPFQSLTVSAIKNESKALHSVADLIREVGLRYQNHDETVDQMFTDLADNGGLSQ